MKKIKIYWSRRDFRLTDNLALSKCIENTKKDNGYFLPVFILEEYMIKADTKYQFGYSLRYFLSKALPKYSEKFNNFFIIKGKAAKFFIDLEKSLKKEYQNDFDLEIYVNEDIYVDFYKQIKKIKNSNIKINIFSDQMTINRDIKSSTGNTYSIFTPFKKAVWENFLKTKEISKIKESDLSSLKYFDLKKVSTFKEKIIKNNFEDIFKIFSKNRKFEIKIKNKIEIIDIDDLLDFKPDFDNLENFYYSEDEALNIFSKYIKKDIENYKKDRDILEINKTSKMSLALSFGLVSSRTLKSKIQNYFKQDFVDFLNNKDSGVVQYISELIWREFYKYIYYHNPKLMKEEFQEKFRNKIKWIDDKEAKKRFVSWIKGETGYKIVDAAMMELAKTGWMHNRSRMIVSSVLTKNLGVDWRWGQEYFRAMLLDLDEASNSGGWQWGASVGADPKPIRIFNPYLQAENYDKNNIYQKKWLGENFDKNIKLIVDHKDARKEALNRYGLSHTENNIVRDY